jgi:hypothetical protein
MQLQRHTADPAGQADTAVHDDGDADILSSISDTSTFIGVPQKLDHHIAGSVLIIPGRTSTTCQGRSIRSLANLSVMKICYQAAVSRLSGWIVAAELSLG